MTWHSVILDANAIICMAIVVRLMFFSKAGKTHRPSYAWMAYLLILELLLASQQCGEAIGKTLGIVIFLATAKHWTNGRLHLMGTRR